VADMRELKLGRRFASHARPTTPLMFTSGPEEGEVIGSYCGEPLYHASLDPVEYEKLLNKEGFTVQAFAAEDPDCGKHSIWLATYGANEGQLTAP